MLRKIAFCWIMIVLGLGIGACSRPDTADVTSAGATATPAAAATPTVTARPSPTATATVTPEPTPIVPAISASAQALTESGQLTIASVTIPEAGWVVIYTEREGQASELLGYSAVSPGANEDVTVTIEPLRVSPVLVAMLHTDAGASGEFEFPGADEPLQWEAAAVATTFAVDIQMLLPAITIADQEVGEDGLVRVENVLSPGPGWLLIHADEAGAIGPVLGQAYLDEGINEDLVITIPWHRATPRLYAALYEDSSEAGRLDYPDADLPVLVNDEPLITPFAITLPPDVFVLDQPVANNQLIIERVISNGPGWLVIQVDDDGSPGLIIGYAPLAAGLNERVVVTVPRASATPQLFIMLHQDIEPIGEFNYPRADLPVTYQGRLMPPFTFRTNAGNYLYTHDQSLNRSADGGATVTVPLAVTDVNAWVVIHNDAGGNRGDVLGMAWLPIGINRDINVGIDPARVTETLHAVLYLDAGTTQQFNFPNGVDMPLQRNRQVIQAPFALLPENEP